jgi:hypothetical protein
VLTNNHLDEVKDGVSREYPGKVVAFRKEFMGESGETTDGP